MSFLLYPNPEGGSIVGTHLGEATASRPRTHKCWISQQIHLKIDIMLRVVDAQDSFVYAFVQA